MSRIKSSSKNLAYAVIQQASSLILTLITRTVFIRFLSIELLGVNSLFSNILTVLSITELGFSTAITYSLYKPVAEHNHEKTAALMQFYRKIYTIIAFVILGLGILLIPFLNLIVKENHIQHLKLYYMFILIDCFISYLFAYKIKMISVHQKNYIIKQYTFVFNVIKSVLQCFVICVFKSFVLYLCIQILYTLSINLYGAHLAQKMYPYISKKAKLLKEETAEIMQRVKSLFLYKIGGIISNHTDNILISIMVGIVAVGQYTNYLTIINAITSITTIIFNTIIYEIGNFVATESKKRQIDIFYKMTFFCNFLFAFLSVCLILLLQDFIVCWLGAEYIIDIGTTIVIVINFYMLGVLNTTFVFRDTIGLFHQMKYVAPIMAVFNIGLSIILGQKIGLFGIILATQIARLLTSFWYEPYIIHKTYFEISFKRYLLDTLKNIGVIFGSVVVLYIICRNIVVTSWILWIAKGIIVTVVTTIIMIGCYYKEENFQYFKNLLGKFLKTSDGV